MQMKYGIAIELVRGVTFKNYSYVEPHLPRYNYYKQAGVARCKVKMFIRGRRFSSVFVLMQCTKKYKLHKSSSGQTKV